MPLVSDIITQLTTVIPTLTDKFSKKLDITSLTQTSGTATATTSVDHGFSTGQVVRISGAQMPLEIDTLIRDDGVVTGTTLQDHDLTLNFQTTIVIQGANETEYNGEHILFDVPNRRTFVYEVETTPSSPATGNIVVFDGKQRGYNGLFTITVTGTDTFTYSIGTNDPISPSEGVIRADSCFRISGGAVIRRLAESYSKQLEAHCWMFVVPGNTFASKNRQFDNDFVYSPAPGDDYRQYIRSGYNIYVFIPTTNEIAGRKAIDDIESIRVFIFKSLLGVKFEFKLNETCDYQFAFVLDEFEEYNTSYYVHRFEFEISAYINEADIVAPELNVAFRDIDLEVKAKIGEALSPELTVTVDLDDEPIIP